MCTKCSGWTCVVFGVLVLLNAFVWPMWWGFDGWMAFFGVLAAIYGLIVALWPCKCCSSCEPCEVEKPKKKK